MTFQPTISSHQKVMTQILETEFIRCEITTCSPPNSSFILSAVFIVVFSVPSWMYNHAKTTPFVLTPRLEGLLTQSMIISEINIRWEAEFNCYTWRLFATVFWDNFSARIEAAFCNSSTHSITTQHINGLQCPASPGVLKRPFKFKYCFVVECLNREWKWFN